VAKIQRNFADYFFSLLVPVFKDEFLKNYYLVLDFNLRLTVHQSYAIINLHVPHTFQSYLNFYL